MADDEFEFAELAAREVKTFVFYTTFTCNLECKHCMFSSCPKRNDSIDFKLFQKGLRDIHLIQRWRDCQIGFSGGEITLHPRWRDMIEAARDLKFKVGIVTNGTTLNDHDAAFLSREEVAVAVSLDGFKEDHEQLRGTGTWETAFNSIGRLGDAGTQCTLNVVVTPESLSRLDKFVSFILENRPNVVRFNIQNVVTHGRANKYNELIFDGSGLERLFYACQKLKSEYLEAKFCHFLYARDFIKRHPCRIFACSGAKCHSGSSNVPSLFNILPDGTLLPLWALLPRRFSAGSLAHTSLETAILNYLGSSAHESLIELTKTVHRKAIRGNRIVFDFAEEAINTARYCAN